MNIRYVTATGDWLISCFAYCKIHGESKQCYFYIWFWHSNTWTLQSASLFACPAPHYLELFHFQHENPQIRCLSFRVVPSHGATLLQSGDDGTHLFTECRRWSVRILHCHFRTKWLLFHQLISNYTRLAKCSANNSTNYAHLHSYPLSVIYSDHVTMFGWVSCQRYDSGEL